MGGTGAECAADSHIRVTVEKGMGIDCPQAMTPDYFVVLYYGEELGPAMKGAVRSMVDFLVREKGMEPYDAYTLLSLAGDVRMSANFSTHQPGQDDVGPSRPGAVGIVAPLTLRTAKLEGPHW